MSYKTGEDLIFALVKTATNFNANNTYQANWKALNKGKDDHYAILRSGESTVEWITLRGYITHYQTIIEIWQRYRDDSTTQTTLYGYIGNILNKLQGTPKLGDKGSTIQDSSVSVANTPEEMWTNNANGPSWLRWKITVKWDELSSI